MTDRQWTITQAGIIFVGGFGLPTLASYAPFVGYWQGILISACLIILALEYADHIRDNRKAQHRDP